MAGILLRLDGGEVPKALAALRRLLVDTKPLMEEIGEIIVSQGQESFANQATPGGEPWLPSLRAQIEGGQTLADSGQLLASLSDEMEIEADTVAVGSSKVYAAIHQLGGQAGRGHAVKLPARAYLPDEDSLDMAEINAAVEAHFQEAFA